MKPTAFLLLISVILFTTPFALAQSNTSYEVKTFISDGNKSKETDATLIIKDNNFQVIPDKQKYISQTKEINYANIKVVDYSNAKKPLLSTGGAITSVVLLGVFAVPFLFMKKKQHWLSIRTEEDFTVLKLSKDNFRQIIAEFDTKKIAVKTVDESNALDIDNIEQAKGEKVDSSNQKKTDEAHAGSAKEDN